MPLGVDDVPLNNLKHSDFISYGEDRNKSVGSLNSQNNDTDLSFNEIIPGINIDNY